MGGRVPLTGKGVDQARAAGTLLKASGFVADVAFSSVLRRATWTLWHALDTLDQSWVPVLHDWRLNERHYGALQGMSKVDAAKQFGEVQVQTWRRHYWARLPRVCDEEHRRCLQDPRYRSLRQEQMPFSESLSDTVARVGACWGANGLSRASPGGNGSWSLRMGIPFERSWRFSCSLTRPKSSGLKYPTAFPCSFAEPVSRGWCGCRCRRALDPGQCERPATPRRSAA